MSATPGVTKYSPRKFVLRICKLGISIAYFAVRFAGGGICRMFGRRRMETHVVLYYHSVPRRYQGCFEEQMKMVASRITPVALGDRYSRSSFTHSVAITFDDALESFVESAVPVLLRLKIPATVFAVTDALGGKPTWGESYYSSDERVMSAKQLVSLPPDLISVGSHTLTHTHLVSLSEPAAAMEISHSREKLERLLDRPVTWFSFPYGEFNDHTVRLCQQAGYNRVFTTEPVLVSGSQDQFVVGRVAADPWDWRLEFLLKIRGAYCWQPYARALKDKIRAHLSQAKRNTMSAKSGSGESADLCNEIKT
jgi:peptidoglycan/xylan/chitin deacetylase (PgdA/CDA1 family)